MDQALLRGGHAPPARPGRRTGAAAALTLAVSGWAVLECWSGSSAGLIPLGRSEESARHGATEVAAVPPASGPHGSVELYMPYVGAGKQTWWVPINMLMSLAALVAAVGYWQAPTKEEQWKAPKLGCDEGQKFFMYAWNCDSQRFRCMYCAQIVCFYHGSVNTDGVKGGHSDCTGPQCSIGPERKQDCKSSELFLCEGCDKDFCEVHIGAPTPERPQCGHACRRASQKKKISHRSSLVEMGKTPELDGPRSGEDPGLNTAFDERWHAYGAPCLVMLLLCLSAHLALPVYRIWHETEDLKFDTRSFTIPAAPLSTMPDTIRNCGCVLIIGHIVLAPVAMSVCTVIAVFSMNFVSTMAKEKIGWKKRSEGQTLGDLVWQSVRVPSRLTLMPFLAVHLLHFLKLIVTEQTTLAGVYANWVNSGMVAFVITGLYGSALSTVMFDRELAGIGQTYLMADITKPVTFRMLASFILLVLQLPSFLRFTWVGMAKWCWLGLAIEVLSALMVQVFFPDAAEMMAAFHRGCRHALTGKLTTPHIIARVAFGVFYFVTLTIFPLQEVMNIVAPHIRIKQAKSPVGPIVRTLLLSLFCLLKTWETQFLFNFELLSSNGVGYLDAVALSYTSRHVKCNACLFMANFESAATVANQTLAAGTVGASVAAEQVWNFFAYLA